MAKFDKPSTQQNFMDVYKWDFQEQIIAKDEEVLFQGISEEAFQAKGLGKIRRFGIFIKNNNEEVIGGVTGFSYYGCLYIDMLWIQKEKRHLGYGTELVLEAEKIGKQRNCSFTTVNTMDWEALPFYQKLGYEIEFTREGYDKNSKLYFLKKKL